MLSRKCIVFHRHINRRNVKYLRGKNAQVAVLYVHLEGGEGVRAIHCYAVIEKWKSLKSKYVLRTKLLKRRPDLTPEMRSLSYNFRARNQ